MTSTPASLGVPALPTSPGVYRFRDERDRVIYVGRATDLRHRVASYWSDLTDRPRLRRMVPQITRVEAVPCASGHEAAWLERNLLEAARPRWNLIRGGLEVPAYITLTRTPTAVRLAVVHDAAGRPAGTAFGPYLGGTRTRAAVDGLERALGLAYAGDRLGGSERDMARVRGVRTDERPRRAATAAAVLEGDPAALSDVLAVLTGRRDDAAAALAFEAAARIQAEIAALQWLTAPQRVTRDAPDGSGTAEVSAWCNGVLVRLEGIDGRVRRWRENLVAAPVRDAGGPTPWLELARDAAALAARLRTASRAARASEV